MIVVFGPSYRSCEQFIRVEFPYCTREDIRQGFLFIHDWQGLDRLRGLVRGIPYLDIGATTEMLDFAWARHMRQISLGGR